MTPCVRPDGPAWFVERAPEWTRALLDGADFRWSVVEGGRCNDRLLEGELGDMTDRHCAYCDQWLPGALEIDHFRPRHEAPQLAFDWGNLFPTCSGCNRSKGPRWSPALLRPDDPAYTFDAVFSLDVVNGHLRPSASASEEGRRRAGEAIDVFGLNRGGLPAARLRVLREGLRGAFRFL